MCCIRWPNFYLSWERSKSALHRGVKGILRSLVTNIDPSTHAPLRNREGCFHRAAPFSFCRTISAQTLCRCLFELLVRRQ